MSKKPVEFSEVQRDPDNLSYKGVFSITPPMMYRDYINNAEFEMTILRAIRDKIIDILINDKKFMNRWLKDVKKQLSEQLTEEVVMTVFKRIVKENK